MLQWIDPLTFTGLRKASVFGIKRWEGLLSVTDTTDCLSAASLLPWKQPRCAVRG